MKNKILSTGLIVGLLVGIVLLAGCTEEQKTGTKTLDTSKITIAEGSLNFDLYLSEDMDRNQQVKYFHIVNNLEKTIRLDVECAEENEFWKIGLRGGDDYDSELIEAGEEMEMPVGAFSPLWLGDYESSGKPGEYSSSITIKAGYIGDDKEDYKTIAVLPIHIKITCALGCCKSGAYQTWDCL